MTGPLNSLKVLDFSTLLPGPFATMMLADLGAEVLRVEAPNRPDMSRMVPPFDNKVSSLHSLLARSKKSIFLDLKKPEAIKIVHELVKQFDILVEQFRPGVMERLGLGYNQLKEINPKLIYCSITGYGQSGSFKQKAGHDINYLSVSGIASYSGTKEHGPAPIGPQIGDLAGGSLTGLVGLLSAVIHRQHTGEGQHVDVAMADSCVALNAINGAAWMACNKGSKREEEPLNGGTFYDYYQTKDQRYLSVGALEPQFVMAFFQVIDHPDWAARAADMKIASQKSLKADIQEVIAQKDLAEWTELFSKVDACVEPVLSIEEVSEHPHFNERGMFVDIEKESGGTQRQIGSPIKFSNTKPSYKWTGGEPGTHTYEVVKNLGLQEDKVLELQKQGVFGSNKELQRHNAAEKQPTNHSEG